MLLTTFRLGSLLALLALLAACSGGSEQRDGKAAVASQIGTAIKNLRARRNAEPPNVTRALIEEIGQTLLEIDVRSRDVTGYFFLLDTRGDVQLWRANDGGQIVLRAGLLTGTRGVGYDLASSSYRPTLAALRNGSGTATRRYDIRDGLNKAVTISAQCRFQRAGTERIVIFDVPFDTRKVEEVCAIEGQPQITNAYWLEQKTGVVLQSLQWMGPDIGQVRLRLIYP